MRRSEGLGVGTRDPGAGTPVAGRRATRRGRRPGWLASVASPGPIVFAVAIACGGSDGRDTSQEGASYRRPKNAAGRADSVRVADLARAELRRRGQGDSLLVASFTRASNGYLLKLVPASTPSAEDGVSVWVDEDGSVTVTQEYRP
jgi:hypothetical protein